MPELLRTPDHHFKDLPNFPYSPNYMYIKDARIHYIDEGKADKGTLLLLHGNPTFSFAFRHVIAAFSSEYRVVAPDFIGFGKSDKYACQEDYSYELHLEMLLEFIRRIEIEEATLVGSNWGAMLGLRALAEVGERFERVVIMNAYLPMGNRELPDAFLQWRTYILNVVGLSVGELIDVGMYTDLSPEIAAIYDTPFPNDQYLSGIRAFVKMVPDGIDHSSVRHMQIARKVAKNWQKPTLLVYSTDGRVAGGAHVWFEHNMLNAQVTHAEIKNARHFMLEDRSEEIIEHFRMFLV